MFGRRNIFRFCKNKCRFDKFFEKGETMKRTFVLAVLVFLMLWYSGCSFEQPGETVAEGHRRHIRNYRVSQQEMMDDVDTLLMLDQPSRLTERTVP